MRLAVPSGLDKPVAEITASSWTTCYNLYLARPALCSCCSLSWELYLLHKPFHVAAAPSLETSAWFDNWLLSHLFTLMLSLPVLLVWELWIKWKWWEHPCPGDSYLCFAGEDTQATRMNCYTEKWLLQNVAKLLALRFPMLFFGTNGAQMVVHRRAGEIHSMNLFLLFPKLFGFGLFFSVSIISRPSTLM